MILDPEVKSNLHALFAMHILKSPKSGQMYRCSSSLVPKERLEEVVEDLIERFGRTVVGDPTLDGVTMGYCVRPAKSQSGGWLFFKNTPR